MRLGSLGLKALMLNIANLARRTNSLSLWEEMLLEVEDGAWDPLTGAGTVWTASLDTSE